MTASSRPGSDEAAWIAGEVVHPTALRLSIADHGFSVGDGLFETCAVRDGVPFALSRHLRRLMGSALTLGLDCPPVETLRQAVAETLHAAPRAGRVRLTVTSGAGPAGAMRADGPATVVVTAGPAPRRALRATVVELPWVRNERSPLTGHKSTSYGESVQGLRYARSRGADEALLANSRGELCEGLASNVLLEIDGIFVTPALDSGCLPGITRQLLLEWAEAAGLAVQEATLSMTVLDEVRSGRAGLLMTSSVRGVTAVSRLDGRRVVQGELAQALSDLYDRRSRDEIDP